MLGLSFQSFAQTQPETPSAAPLARVAAPLELGVVLSRSRVHFPMILEALEAEKAAQAQSITAAGAFDPVVNSEGFSRVTGFWSGSIVDSEVNKRLSSIGADVFLGYKISNGEFPIYEDINFTDTGGAFKLGFFLSLLRDRAFDPQRAGVRDAELAAAAARFDVLATKIDVQARASIAYFEWVAAALRYDVLANLLDIALVRDRALSRRVEEGDAPSILLVENEQNILRRQALLAEAERDVDVAAVQLGGFNRDELGLPTPPARIQTPDAFPPLRARELGYSDNLMADLRSQRPEFALLDVNLAKLENELALRENALKPKLDFGFEYQRDVGDVAEGGISRQGNDTILSFRFSMPIGRRAAKGQIAETKAKMSALTYRRRMLTDQIQLELLSVSRTLDAAIQLVDLARREAEQAELMRQAEKRLFEEGASDFFLLNRREEFLADAQVRVVDAFLRYHVTAVNFDAATVDLARLGLRVSPDPSREDG